LGRGSREIDKRSTGTLITKQEIPCSVEKVIDVYKLDDQRRADNLKILSGVA
jgi:hypothetical protein